MSFDMLNRLVTRAFFFGAFLLLLLGVLDRIAEVFGATLPLLGRYTPGRLLEFSAILLIFVIALLLRQIREELKKRG